MVWWAWSTNWRNVWKYCCHKPLKNKPETKRNPALPREASRSQVCHSYVQLFYSRWGYRGGNLWRTVIIVIIEYCKVFLPEMPIPHVTRHAGRESQPMFVCNISENCPKMSFIEQFLMYKLLIKNSWSSYERKKPHSAQPHTLSAAATSMSMLANKQQVCCLFVNKGIAAIQ